MSMNPEIKEQWIAALESGEYKQCQGKLTRVDSEGKKTYCCLGVLTELAVKAGITTVLDPNDFGYVVYDDRRNYQASITPLVVADWAGLDKANPIVAIEDGRYSLSSLNDGGMDGWSESAFTFPEIAALIRAQL